MVETVVRCSVTLRKLRLRQVVCILSSHYGSANSPVLDILGPHVAVAFLFAAA